MRKVLTLVDRGRDGAVRRSACALLTIARRFGEPVAVVDGHADAELVKTLGHLGASEIYCLPEAIEVVAAHIEPADPASDSSGTVAEPRPLLESAQPRPSLVSAEPVSG